MGVDVSSGYVDVSSGWDPMGFWDFFVLFLLDLTPIFSWTILFFVGMSLGNTGQNGVFCVHGENLTVDASSGFVDVN